MRGLTDRVVVVAGGASGMGAAAARRLAAEGAKVVVGDINLGGAESTAHSIESAGGEAVAVQYDQAAEESIANLIAQAVDHFGGLHGLHANAADLREDVLGRDGDVLEMDVGLWEWTLRVNLIGTALIIRSALPHILASGGGGIVCTTSDGVLAGEPNKVAYSGSKAGIEALVRHVATRWGKQGVRCNAVAPGFVMSETAHAYLEREGPTVYERVMSKVRSPRLGEADDVAATVAFLISEDAAWINGQVWSVNGGAFLRQ